MERMENTSEKIEKILNEKFYKVKGFTPEFHKEVMAEMRSRKTLTDEQIRNYFESVRDRICCQQANFYYSTDPELIDVVDFWLKRGGLEKKTSQWILSYGVQAAINQANLIALEWTELAKCKAKRHKPAKFGPFPECSCPDCLERLKELSTDIYKTQAAKSIEGKKVKSLTKKDLDFVFWANHKGLVWDILFYDTKNDRLWLTSDRGMFVFDGKTILPVPVVNYSSLHDADEFINNISSCDERALLWSGQYTSRSAQRYGKYILFMCGDYNAAFSQTFMTTYWFEFNNEQEAHDLFVEMSRPFKTFKPINVFYDTKADTTVMRDYKDYGKGNYHSMGVYKNELRTWSQGTKKFETEEEAIAFFEAEELRKIKQGIAFKDLCMLDNKKYIPEPVKD